MLKRKLPSTTPYRDSNNKDHIKSNIEPRNETNPIYELNKTGNKNKSKINKAIYTLTETYNQYRLNQEILHSNYGLHKQIADNSLSLSHELKKKYYELPPITCSTQHVLNNSPASLPKLSDEEYNKTITIVFDLDLTLIHAHGETESNPNKNYPIILRPYVRQTLIELKSLDNIELIIWTHGVYKHAINCCKLIDPNRKLFRHIIARASLDETVNKKELLLLPRNIEQTILIDDKVQIHTENPHSSRFYLPPYIPKMSDFIKSSEPEDKELLNLCVFLTSIINKAKNECTFISEIISKTDNYYTFSNIEYYTHLLILDLSVNSMLLNKNYNQSTDNYKQVLNLNEHSSTVYNTISILIKDYEPIKSILYSYSYKCVDFIINTICHNPNTDAGEKSLSDHALEDALQESFNIENNLEIECTYSQLIFNRIIALAKDGLTAQYIVKLIATSITTFHNNFIKQNFLLPDIIDSSINIDYDSSLTLKP